jgi:hypothetical protein
MTEGAHGNQDAYILATDDGTLFCVQQMDDDHQEIIA